MNGRPPLRARRRFRPVNEALGHTGVLLGFAAAIVGIVVIAVGLAKGRTSTIRNGRVYAPIILLGGVIAMAAMEHALLTHDFSLAYVADNNSRDTPVLYSITGLWSALAGSILLWGLVLGGYATAMVWRFRRRSGEDLVGWATLVVYRGGRVLLRSHARPRRSVPARGRGRFRPTDPVPTHCSRTIPSSSSTRPMLYLGLVGFTLPFAFAIASLITGRARRGLAGRDPPVDPVRLGVPHHGDPARGLVVLRGARVGRVLGVGPGRERRAVARGWWAPRTCTR